MQCQLLYSTVYWLKHSVLGTFRRAALVNCCAGDGPHPTQQRFSMLIFASESGLQFASLISCRVIERRASMVSGHTATSGRAAARNVFSARPSNALSMSRTFSGSCLGSQVRSSASPERSVAFLQTDFKYCILNGVPSRAVASVGSGGPAPLIKSWPLPWLAWGGI